MQVLHGAPGLTPRQELTVTFLGFMTIIILGICASVALVLGLLWVTCQFLLLAVQSTIETLTTISTLYATSDPLIRFFLLVSVGYIIYRLYLHTRKVKL